MDRSDVPGRECAHASSGRGVTRRIAARAAIGAAAIGAIFALCAAACVRVTSGAYLCDDRGACPSPLVCNADRRCVDAVDGGDAGVVDAGSVVDAGDAVDAGPLTDAGPLDAGTSVDAGNGFTTVAAGTVDAQLLEVSAAIDAAGLPHVALWSQNASPVDDRVQYATCSGACAAGDWTFTLLKDQVIPGAPHPVIAVDAQNRPRIAYASAATVFVAACDSACTSSSSWHTATVASNAAGPRLAFDGTVLVAFSCVGPLASSVVTMSRCAGNCGVDASWTSTPLPNAGSCTAVTDLAFDGGRGVAMLATAVSPGFTTFKLRQARCAGSCTSASSWSAVDVVATATAHEPSGRYRFLPSNGAVLFDLERGTLGICASCAPQLPPSPFALDLVTGAGDLETHAGIVDVVRQTGDTAWHFGSCAAGSCSAAALGDVPLGVTASQVDLVLDGAGRVHAASIEGNALSWSSAAP